MSRPAILVGGGLSNDRTLFRDLAAKLDVPCFRTWNALDIVTDDLPQYAGTVGTYGGPGRNFGIQNCDQLLVLGCRVSGRITGGSPETFARAAQKVIVDVDQPMASPSTWTQTPAAAVMREWLESPPVQGNPAWLARCLEWRNKYDPVKPEMLSGDLHHYGFMRRLSEALPSDAIVTYDTGGNAIMMGHCFRAKWGQRIFSSNGNSPMGFSFCGALGAWFAEPHRPVICIIGDGGFNMNLQEIQTLISYGANVKTFIVNNHILGNTKSFQRVNGKAELACGPDGYKPPDFCRIAEAYGCSTMRVHTFAHAQEALDRVILDSRPWIVDVVHHDFCTYEPRVSHWDGGIEEMHPPLPADEFLANMLVPPVDGWQERAARSR